MLYKFRWFTSSVVGIVMVCLDQWEKHQLCRYFLEHELQMACWGFPDWRGSWQTWEFIDTSQRWWMVVPDVLHCVCFFLMCVPQQIEYLMNVMSPLKISFTSFTRTARSSHIHQPKIQDRDLGTMKSLSPWGPWHSNKCWSHWGCFCYIKTRSFAAVSHRFLSSLYRSVE